MNPTNYRILGENIGNNYYIDYPMNEVLNIWHWDGFTKDSKSTTLSDSDPNGKIFHYNCTVDGDTARLFIQGTKIDNGDIIGVNLCMFKEDGTLIKKSPLIRDDDTSTCYDGVDLISLMDLKVSGEDKGTPSYGSMFETNGSSIKNLFNKFYYFGEITQNFTESGNTVDFAPLGTRPGLTFTGFWDQGPGDYVLNSKKFGPQNFNQPLKAIVILLCAGGGGGKGAAWGTKNGGGGGGALAFYILNIRDFSFNIHIGNGGAGGGYDENGTTGENSYIELSDGTRIVTLYGGGGGTEDGGSAGQFLIELDDRSITGRKNGEPVPILKRLVLSGSAGGSGIGSAGFGLKAEFSSGPGAACEFSIDSRGGYGSSKGGGGGGASIGDGGDAVDVAGVQGSPGILGSGGGGGANQVFDGGNGGKGGDGVAWVFY